MTDFQQEIREAIRKIEGQSYADPFLLLHPKDHAHLQIDQIGREAIEKQKKIADAFDLPYYMVGIPGYRAPWKVRWHPRAVRYRLARRRDEMLTRIPGVRLWGRRGSGGWMDPEQPRFGRWWVWIGRYSLGWGDREDWY